MNCKTTEFDLRLTFDKDTKDPSRLFRTMAKSIDALNLYDTLIAKTLGIEYQTEISLTDIEKGSILAKLKSYFKGDVVPSLSGAISENNTKEYIARSREIALDLIESRNYTVENVVASLSKIDVLAADNGFKDRLDYKEPDIITFSNAINGVADSVKELTEQNEQVEYTNYDLGDDAKTFIIKGHDSHIDLKEIEESITERQVVSTAILSLKVKRPDYLGDSKWDFKFDKKTINVKILDEEWLVKFKKGIIVIPAGSSLSAEVRIIHKYDKASQLISETYEIIRVIKIV